METATRLNKLKWLCRRGMKELDLLLEKFVADNEQQLVQGDWPEFEKFLRIEDDRMWGFLQNLQQPEAHQFRQLLYKIRYGTAGPH